MCCHSYHNLLYIPDSRNLYRSTKKLVRQTGFLIQVACSKQKAAVFCEFPVENVSGVCVGWWCGGGCGFNS